MSSSYYNLSTHSYTNAQTLLLTVAIALTVALTVALLFMSSIFQNKSEGYESRISQNFDHHGCSNCIQFVNCNNKMMQYKSIGYLLM